VLAEGRKRIVYLLVDLRGLDMQRVSKCQAQEPYGRTAKTSRKKGGWGRSKKSSFQVMERKRRLDGLRDVIQEEEQRPKAADGQCNCAHDGKLGVGIGACGVLVTRGSVGDEER